MSKWRPISEYEPAPFDPEHWFIPSERVLVCTKSGVDIARYGYTAKGRGRWRDESGRVCYPTHWMPLPEPPKEPTPHHFVHFICCVCGDPIDILTEDYRGQFDHTEAVCEDCEEE